MGWTIEADDRTFRGGLRSDADAARILNNALCVHLPRRLGFEADDPEGRRAFAAAFEALLPGPLMGAVRELSRLPDAPPEPDPRSPPLRRLVLGLDIGGTDAKWALLRDGEVVRIGRKIWNDPLSRIPNVLAFMAMTRGALAQAIGSDRPEAVGLAWPDLVRGGQIVGGLSGKLQGISAVYGSDPAVFRRELDGLRHIPPGLSDVFKLPIAACGDGLAAAWWAASLGRSSCLCLSLGTSLAGSSVDPDGRPLDAPAYASGLVIRDDPDPATAHPLTGLHGVARSYATQTGLLRRIPGAGPPSGRLELARRGSLPIWEDAGRALGETIAELRSWMPWVREVLLSGRVVAGDSPGVRALLDAARGEVPIVRASEIAPPWPDPEVYSQAIGVALRAARVR